MKPDEEAEPPQPPPFQRRIQISRLQLSGVALLALLPIAALTGLLGTKQGEAGVSAGPLELTARYPARMHYQTSEAIELRVKNTGGEAMDGVVLRLDGRYLEHFENTQFRPPVQRLDEAGAEIDLGPLPPGETRMWVVELRANDFGTHGGRMSAAATGTTPVALDVSTLVLP